MGIEEKMSDYQMEQWVKETLPNDKMFSQDAVKILMRLAYQEGRKKQERSMTEKIRDDFRSDHDL